MIYNENGVVIDNSFTDKELLEYLDSSCELDSILSEGVNEVLQSGQKVIRLMMDKIGEFIDWLQKLRFKKQIEQIEKNKSRIIEILKGNKSPDIKSVAVYVNSSGLGGRNITWVNSFTSACKCIKSDTTLKSLEYMLYDGKNKDSWFKFEGGGGGYDVEEKIVKYAISVKDELKSLRDAYSEIKVLNTKIDKGEKISNECMSALHKYLVNAIRSYRDLSIKSIKICIKALNSINGESDNKEKDPDTKPKEAQDKSDKKYNDRKADSFKDSEDFNKFMKDKNGRLVFD